jgi:DNA mismatch repair protein MutS
VNAERFITPEMKEYEALVLNAEERIREIENRCSIKSVPKSVNMQRKF